MRKNILILGHNYATQFVDIFNQYACLFDKTKYHVTVAYLTGKPDDSVKARTLADEVIFLEASKKSIRGLKIAQIGRMLALCRQRQFDMVICHRYKPSYLMMWVAQFIKIRALIFVMHELNTMTAVGRRLLIAALYRKNMVFAGVSNAVRDDIRQHIWRVPTNNVITLYNVIDVSLTEPQLLMRHEARAALKVNEHEFLFAQLARLVPNKNQHCLIKAFAAIKPDCPNAKLMIIGEGILEASLKQEVLDLNMQHDIIFTGYLALGFRYTKGFDCFVLSSTQEAFGRVLLEAMIGKCPIIATRANGIPEVMGNAGMLIPVNDIDALSQAMKTIYQLSTAAKQRMVEDAYTHMQTHFSLPVFHQTFWQLPQVVGAYS